MIYSIEFTPTADKIIQKWKRSNPHLYKKLVKVMLDIARNPRSGIGHPEPLKGGGEITYSRHITAHDRIVYDIYDEVIKVLIIQVGGHYNDK